GCYTDSIGDRALAGTYYFDEELTVQKCATFCADYTFLGTEYGGECYCGDTLGGSGTGGQEALEADCSMTCKGNSGQKCGAGYRVSVYE
ncbi:carbohydrate-binding WSC, partial [Eremomyces bilateralis CBS 781.70]